MVDNQRADRSEHIYRVDKFVVPDHAREEFLTRVEQTHEFLRTLPGFLQDFVLEQSAGSGLFNFITIVEWNSPDSVENAKVAVASRHRELNFSPQELRERLGIRADLANYRQVNL